MSLYTGVLGIFHHIHTNYRVVGLVEEILVLNELDKNAIVIRNTQSAIKTIVMIISLFYCSPAGA
jgi:hypothetical protein